MTSRDKKEQYSPINYKRNVAGKNRTEITKYEVRVQASDDGSDQMDGWGKKSEDRRGWYASGIYSTVGGCRNVRHGRGDEDIEKK